MKIGEIKSLLNEVKKLKSINNIKLLCISGNSILIEYGKDKILLKSAK